MLENYDFLYIKLIVLSFMLENINSHCINFILKKDKDYANKIQTKKIKKKEKQLQ